MNGRQISDSGRTGAEEPSRETQAGGASAARKKAKKVTLSEVDAQPYQDCRFSSGLVRGHKHDRVYLKFERDSGPEPTIILLRKDEAARICALLANAIWSAHFYR